MHDEEVARKVFRLDDIELAGDAGAVGLARIGIRARNRRPHKLAQPTHRGVAGRHLLPGQIGLGLPQAEAELGRERDAARHGARVPREQPLHLGAAAQV